MVSAHGLPQALGKVLCIEQIVTEAHIAGDGPIVEEDVDVGMGSAGGLPIVTRCRLAIAGFSIGCVLEAAAVGTGGINLPSTNF